MKDSSMEYLTSLSEKQLTDKTARRLAKDLGENLQEVKRYFDDMQVPYEPVFKYVAVSLRGMPDIFTTRKNDLQAVFFHHWMTRSLWHELGYRMLSGVAISFSSLDDGEVYSTGKKFYVKDKHCLCGEGKTITWKELEKQYASN